MRFFSNNPDGRGLVFHETDKEAQKQANEALEAYRENASDEGWDDNVGDVCWGEVRQIATASETPAEEGETFNGELIDFYVDYQLEPPIDLSSTEISALNLLTEIRFALGDNGKRMQDELIEYCKELKLKKELYEVAIMETLKENANLADGENCTLWRLKKAIGE